VLSQIPDMLATCYFVWKEECGGLVEEMRSFHLAVLQAQQKAVAGHDNSGKLQVFFPTF